MNFMAKKLLMGLLAVLVVAGGVAALSAYEAHVINVTAHIENALTVHPEDIEFGTVFPQEYVEDTFWVALSQSFLDEKTVNDVEYKITQKPKCVDRAGNYYPVDYATHKCPVLETGEQTQELPLLCPFLSKLNIEHDVDEGAAENDKDLPSYYVEYAPDYCVWPNTGEASGMLVKTIGDYVDSWTVDLKVPPVDGYVGQDWPAGCPTVPTNDITYGCDLWIEITNISEMPK
jgi:hypothetical protein